MSNDYLASIRALSLLVFIFILSACTTGVTEAPKTITAIPSDTQLHQAHNRPEEERLLDVSIEIFNVAASAQSQNKTEQWVFSDITQIERQYLPILLRNTLVKSQYWGAVSVSPKADLAADLSITGKITRSDGNNLNLHIKATDASGRHWLNKEYRAIIRTHNNDSFQQSCEIPITPYSELYRQVANDLLSFRLELSDAQLLNIRRVAQIRHAQDLSPDAFNDLTQVDNEGNITVKRLLAENDPILQQVEKMQSRHYVFVETVDEHYQSLHLQMKAIYQLWQQYSCERAVELELRQLSKGSKRRRYSGGFSSIADNYRRYKISKMFEQEWQQLANSFKQEVSPAVIELNDNVYTLSGSVDQQLEEWRELLRKFYAIQSTP